MGNENSDRFFSPMKVSIGGKPVYEPGDDKSPVQQTGKATEAVRKLVQRRQRQAPQKRNSDLKGKP